MSDSSALQLLYSFTASHNPILVSEPGGNPSVIDLSIVINTPGANAVAMNRVLILIPVGTDSGPTLSQNAGFSRATVNDEDWRISIDGGTLRLTPSAQGSGTFGATTVVITLPQITVNHVFGTVPITITEDKATDSTTYSIVKQPVTCPVTSFYANPPAIPDIGEVTLYWTCNDLGPNFSYSVRAAGWTPSGCAGCATGGPCFSVNDGRTGIVTPDLPLDAAQPVTQFFLDIIQVDNGARTVTTTLDLTVQLVAPSLSTHSSARRIFSGYMHSLHWRATNAAFCQVELGGVPVVTNAPVNTYRLGYTIPANLTVAPPWTYTVKAFDQTAQVMDHIDLNPQFAPEPPAVASLPGNWFGFAAITPDSRTAVCLALKNGDQSFICKIDLASQQVTSVQLPEECEAACLMPDGVTVLAVSDNFVLYFVDIPSMTVDPNSLSLPSSPFADNPAMVAVTPDGKTAYVNSIFMHSLAVVDLSSRSFTSQNFKQTPEDAGYFGVMLFTPDGKIGIVRTFNGHVCFFDLASQSLLAHIPGNTNVWTPDCVLTPDSTRLICASSDRSSLFVIDVASRTLLAEILLQPHPGTSIDPVTAATTADGRYALLPARNAGLICIADLTQLQVTPYIIPFATAMKAIVSPDGAKLVVFDGNSRCGIFTQLPTTLAALGATS
jgi:DNA-binding beta-propeller fold protein YncE